MFDKEHPSHGATFFVDTESSAQFKEEGAAEQFSQYLKALCLVYFPGLIDESQQFDAAESQQAWQHLFPHGVLSDLFRDATFTHGLHIDGNGKKAIDALDTTKRHLHRAGMLLKILVENKFIEQIQTKQLSTISNLNFAYIIGVLHDIGRFIDNGDQHEYYNELILEHTGFVPEITQALHKPVPLEGEFDASTYDTDWQKLLRLADLFSKNTISDDEGLVLRTSIEAVCDYSKTRQYEYWRTGQNDPKSDWYQKSEADVALYLERECAVLWAAADWYKQVFGVELALLLQEINKNPREFFEMDAGNPWL